jgi:hypothetical protein
LGYVHTVALITPQRFGFRSKFAPDALYFSVTKSDPAGRYSIIKDVITHPHHACLLQKTQITGADDFLDKLRLYVLCAPHLEVGGWKLVQLLGRRALWS